MKPRKPDKFYVIFSNQSNIALAIRARMPIVPTNLAPPPPPIARTILNTTFIDLTTSVNTSTSQRLQELQTTTTSASRKALQQILPCSGKRSRKKTKIYGLDRNDSSEEFTNSCQFATLQTKKMCRQFCVFQPSIVQSNVDTAAQNKSDSQPVSFARHWYFTNHKTENLPWESQS